MANPKSSNNILSVSKDDFDTKEIIRGMEGHAKDMSSLTTRVEELENKFGTNEKIADTLCITAEKAVKMQTMLATTFVTLLNSNEEVKKGITDIINKTDRNYMVLFIKRFGLVTWTLIVTIVTAIVTAVVKSHWGS